MMTKDHRTSRRWYFRCRGAALLLLALIVAPIPAQAQEEHALGFHAGLSLEPDHFVAGASWRSPRLFGPARVQTAFESGIADDEWSGALNLDVAVSLPLGASRWRLLQGGGAVIGVSRVDTEPFRSTFDSAIGVAYIAGVEHTSGFFTAVRLSAGDVPRFKLVAGWLISLD